MNSRPFSVMSLPTAGRLSLSEFDLIYKEKISITINPLNDKQTIHSFGASDCWTAKFIGKWADIEKKNRVADLLFSTDTLSDGSPKGIGLSLWRFNIGGGSFEQGAAS